MVANFLVHNLELVVILYALLIRSICAFLVLKIDRMFKISDYQGLRYIRNSFFFYGISFLALFVVGKINPVPFPQFPQVIWFLFKFFILSATLFLIYSLVWKKVERVKSHNSLLNPRSILIYIVALTLAFVGGHVFYITQIILSLSILIISLNNLIKNKNKYPFLKYYFLAICASLLHWAMSYFLYLGAEFSPLLMGSIVANLAFFLIFLGGILNISKK